jgi:hypothetical protein
VFGAEEGTPVAPPRPPRIARIYGLGAVAFGMLVAIAVGKSLLATMARVSDFDGFGLAVVVALAVAPSFLLVYLGTRIIRGERMAAYGLAAVATIVAVAVIMVEWHWGLVVMAVLGVVLAPLCTAATRDAGGFH